MHAILLLVFEMAYCCMPFVPFWTEVEASRLELQWLRFVKANSSCVGEKKRCQVHYTCVGFF